MRIPACIKHASVIGASLALFVVILFSVPSTTLSQGDLQLPLLPPADVYGDTLIDRSSLAKKVTPVVFSHWVHRVKFTCRVCHYELEFAMIADETPIVCDGKITGRFCTSCHNGKISFAPKDEKGENCKRCHNATSSPNREKFHELQSKLPRSKYGNEIDWNKALNEGLIQPKRSLSETSNAPPLHLDKTLTLRAELSGIPPGVFPHGTHEKWLDCSNCHPDLFNIKKKSTESLRKWRMIKGESCGYCHLRVAFPLNDCKRCHPRMRG